ncbi:MAG TPA: 3-methylornithyl-N6-L-lysine dehydrogenase PylD [Bacillota bacterium]|nr:3-methylornithyl-N6-L-lysine dehydrogenase PylD [Bacillota bacterium]
MTRLITDWIADIETTARDLDREMQKKTGLSYAALAAKVGGYSVSDIDRAAQAIRIAAVPVTAGLGLIGSFAESVASIVRAAGFESFVTERTDVDGLWEAYENGADIVYMADDDRFISINLNKKKMANNDYATAFGYTAALEGALGSLVGKEILVLGCGTVGREFMKCLKKKGVTFAAYDIDRERLAEIKAEGISVVEASEEIRNYQYLMDATNQGGWLHADMLHPQVWISAPGVPLSLDREALKLHEGRLIHDPLQIGVVSMLGLTL